MVSLSKVIRLAVLALALSFLLQGQPAEARNKYAALVMNASTGEVMFARNSNSFRHPASLTKIMTLYMLFEQLEAGRLTLNSKLTVSARATRQPPSKLALRRGQKITVETAIKALVTKSANDVAVTVAEALAGTERRFAQRMTKKARALGMSRTTFRNASGLHHSKQVTTARDMAKLAIAVRRDFPQYYPYFSAKSFRYGRAVYRNHNKLLGRYTGTDGIKTGYINASGFNLVASVERNGERLIGVVFGGKSGARRDRHMKAILDKNFKRLHEIRIANLVPPLPEGRPTKDTIGALVVASATAAVPKPEEPPEIGSRDEGGDWGVQVGAYSSETMAALSMTSAIEVLPVLLEGTDRLLQPLEKSFGTIYRARLVGLTEPEARTACVKLRRAELPCVPVPADLVNN